MKAEKRMIRKSKKYIKLYEKKKSYEEKMEALKEEVFDILLSMN